MCIRDRLGGYHFGTRIALGTGGDDMALEGLSNIFAKPEGYNVLPYKNYDTEWKTISEGGEIPNFDAEVANVSSTTEEMCIRDR